MLREHLKCNTFEVCVAQPQCIRLEGFSAQAEQRLQAERDWWAADRRMSATLARYGFASPKQRAPLMRADECLILEQRADF